MAMGQWKNGLREISKRARENGRGAMGIEQEVCCIVCYRQNPFIKFLIKNCFSPLLKPSEIRTLDP